MPRRKRPDGVSPKALVAHDHIDDLNSGISLGVTRQAHSNDTPGRRADGDRQMPALLLAREPKAVQIVIRNAMEKTRFREQCNEIDFPRIEFDTLEWPSKVQPHSYRMVKPAEKFGGITIHKVVGFGAGCSSATTVDGEHGGNGGSDGLINQAFDEIRRNAFDLPALSAIGKSVGINMDTGLAGVLGKEFSPESMSRAIGEALPAIPADDDEVSATYAGAAVETTVSA